MYRSAASLMKLIGLVTARTHSILYIWGDNGASAEGQNGTISELLAQNGIPSTTKQHIAALNTLGGLDVLGSPKPTLCIMPAGPGRAVRLIRRPSSSPRILVARAIRWLSAGLQRSSHDATPRAQFLHVNDVAPTIYDIVGITPPRLVNGVPQDQFDGASFASTFNDPKAKEVKQTQYFEVMGSRGHLSRWLDGIRVWSARAMGYGLAPRHQAMDARQRTSGNSTISTETGRRRTTSPSKMPAKLADMKDLFLIELTKNKGLPIGGGLWIPILHP